MRKPDHPPARGRARGADGGAQRHRRRCRAPARSRRAQRGGAPGRSHLRKRSASIRSSISRSRGLPRCPHSPTSSAGFGFAGPDHRRDLCRRRPDHDRPPLSDPGRDRGRDVDAAERAIQADIEAAADFVRAAGCSQTNRRKTPGRGVPVPGRRQWRRAGLRFGQFLRQFLRVAVTSILTSTSSRHIGRPTRSPGQRRNRCARA